MGRVFEEGATGCKEAKLGTRWKERTKHKGWGETLHT